MKEETRKLLDALDFDEKVAEKFKGFNINSAEHRAHELKEMAGQTFEDTMNEEEMKVLYEFFASEVGKSAAQKLNTANAQWHGLSDRKLNEWLNETIVENAKRWMENNGQEEQPPEMPEYDPSMNTMDDLDD